MLDLEKDRGWKERARSTVAFTPSGRSGNSKDQKAGESSSTVGYVNYSSVSFYLSISLCVCVRLSPSPSLSLPGEVREGVGHDGVVSGSEGEAHAVLAALDEVVLEQNVERL